MSIMQDANSLLVQRLLQNPLVAVAMVLTWVDKSGVVMAKMLKAGI